MSDADEVALRGVVEAYASAVDRADGAAVGALFDADGVLALWMDPASPERTGERCGPASIARAVDGIARYRATHHTISSFVVHASDGDIAHGQTRCTAHHVEDDGQGGWQDRVLYVHYDDTFRRHSRGWRLLRREMHVDWVSILPVHG